MILLYSKAIFIINVSEKVQPREFIDDTSICNLHDIYNTVRNFNKNKLETITAHTIHPSYNSVNQSTDSVSIQNWNFGNLSMIDHKS